MKRNLPRYDGGNYGKHETRGRWGLFPAFVLFLPICFCFLCFCALSLDFSSSSKTGERLHPHPHPHSGHPSALNALPVRDKDRRDAKRQRKKAYKRLTLIHEKFKATKRRTVRTQCQNILICTTHHKPELECLISLGFSLYPPPGHYHRRCFCRRRSSRRSRNPPPPVCPVRPAQAASR